MRRKIVQHGPSTLTVSLPSAWAKRNQLHKGDELVLDESEHDLTLRPHTGATIRTTKRVSVRGMRSLLHRILGSMYKIGHDDLVLTYQSPEELREIHYLIRTQFIGMEIIDETQTSVHVRAVSAAGDEQFATLFRRLFHFLNAIAQDSLDAARAHDIDAYRTLVLRDESINRLADFCARVLITRGQHEYASDVVVYDVINQIEKVGDAYKHLHLCLLGEKDGPDERMLTLYEDLTELVRAYTELFFNFSLERAHAFQDGRNRIIDEADTLGHPRIVRHLERVVQELYNLMDATLMLHL